MRAFKCDICNKFEAGASNTVMVAYITYETCTDCLEKIKDLISKIEKQASKGKPK